jgi:hypothetical protein
MQAERERKKGKDKKGDLQDSQERLLKNSRVSHARPFRPPPGVPATQPVCQTQLLELLIN